MTTTPSRSRENSGAAAGDLRPTNERVLVRPAAPNEYARAGEVVVAAYETEGYLTLPDGSYDVGYASQLADAAGRTVGSEVLVAEVDGEIAGSFTWCGPGSPMRERAVRDDQGEFRMLGVLPSARGRGVAAAMVGWCLERAAQDALTEVVISSLPEMHAAHRVYTAHGFVRRPDLDWSPYPGVELIGFSTAVRGMPST